jgi:hypothetical protein
MLRVFLGNKHAEAVQGYQSIALVAGQMFGSDNDNEVDDANVKKPQTRMEMESAFSTVFGK